MTPAFDSWQAFFAMGVHAFFVWTSAAVTIGSMLLLTFFIVYQQKKCEQRVKRQLSLSASSFDDILHNENG